MNNTKVAQELISVAKSLVAGQDPFTIERRENGHVVMVIPRAIAKQVRDYSKEESRLDAQSDKLQAQSNISEDQAAFDELDVKFQKLNHVKDAFSRKYGYSIGFLAEAMDKGYAKIGSDFITDVEIK